MGRVRLVRTISLLCVSCAIVVLCHGACQATIRYVSPDGGEGNWANAYTTIGAAIAAATSGDEVRVKGYTNSTVYNEHIDVKSGVSVYGGYTGQVVEGQDVRDVSGHPSVISAASRSNSVVYVPSGVTNATVIDGFTIKDGIGCLGLVGGGIYCLGSPTITNCHIHSNSVDSNGSGGGIFCGSGTSPVISDNVIENNAAGYGGGLCWYGGTATGNAIRDNTAVSYGAGVFFGSYWSMAGTFHDNPEISGNTTTSSVSYGGGIYLSAGGSAFAWLTGNTVSENVAYVGGGIYSQGQVTMSANYVLGNGGSSTIAYGGIYMGSSSTCLSNVVASNEASSCGGVYVYQLKSANFVNNTVVGNTGGGLYINSLVGGCSLSNNIVSGNSPTGIAAPGTSYSCYRNCVHDTSNSNYPPSTCTDITDDPLLDANYHLTWESPCIDEGYDAAVVSGWKDIDNEDRQSDILTFGESGVQVDIGADERYDYTPPSTPVVNDGDYTSSTTQLHASWESTDQETGIHGYRYALGTAQYPDDGWDSVCGWTLAGSLTECTRQGTYSPGVYYWAVKALNNQSLWSEVGVSDGIIVDPTVPRIRIVTPLGNELHLATGETTVRLEVEATDEVGVDYVEITVAQGSPPSHPWDYATYSATTHTWAKDWTNVTAGTYTIWARATDLAGNNSVEVSRSVTVSTNADVIYVDCDATGDCDGTSWDDAYTSLSEALDYAYYETFENPGSVDEIWVAEGTYTPASSFNLVSSVDLYGGFEGDERAREERNWNTHQTVLGTVSGSSVSDVRVDGFVITACSTGISVSDSSNIEICHSEITQIRTGISCAWSSAYIHDNYIHCSVYCWGFMTSGLGIYGYGAEDLQIINNTIADSMMGSGYGVHGAAIATNYGTSASIYNNVLLRNEYGVKDDGTGTLGIHNNCAYGNADDYPNINVPGDNISADPKLVAGAYLRPDSPCIDAGVDDFWQTGDVDFYRDNRNVDITGVGHDGTDTVDIGAVENDGCGLDVITVRRSPSYAVPGGSVTVTATITDWDSQAVSGVRVAFSVTDGTITHVNGREVVGSDYHGFTDSSGQVSATVTRSTSGRACLTMEAPSSCGTGRTTRVCYVCFCDGVSSDEWPMFQRDLAHTGVTQCMLPPDPCVQWSVPLLGGDDSGEALWSSPVVADGVVYVGTDSGDLYAFDAEDGDEIEHVNLGSPIHGAPCVSGGMVYVGTQTGGQYGQGVLYKLFAVGVPGHDPFDLDWSFDCSTGDYIYGSPVVYAAEGVVCFGTTWADSTAEDSGRLYTVDLTSGTNRGSSPAVTRYGVLYPTPAIDTSFSGGARCYIGDDSCFVTATRCDTGLKLWDWHPDATSFYSSPTISCGYIFGGSSGWYLYRIVDAGSTWQLPDPASFDTEGCVYSTAAALGGKVYFASSNTDLRDFLYTYPDISYMYCVDAAAFSYPEDWATDLGSPTRCSALISQPTSILFVCTGSGVLHALDIADGAILWSHDFSGDIPWPASRSSLAAADGRLFVVVGNDAGRHLYCFGP